MKENNKTDIIEQLRKEAEQKEVMNVSWQSSREKQGRGENYGNEEDLERA